MSNKKTSSTPYTNICVNKKAPKNIYFLVHLNVNKVLYYKENFKTLKEAILCYNSVIREYNLLEKYKPIYLKSDEEILEEEKQSLINRMLRDK